MFKGILIMIGYFVGITFLEYTWDANYLSAVESMPTQLRASSLGSCSMIARIGGFFSPVVNSRGNFKQFEMNPNYANLSSSF
jgi:hypothetical protein